MLCCLQWFPSHRGMASGMVVAGFGAGSTIFTQVQTYFINPDDLTANIPSTEGDCIQTERLDGGPLLVSLHRPPSGSLSDKPSYSAV